MAFVLRESMSCSSLQGQTGVIYCGERVVLLNFGLMRTDSSPNTLNLAAVNHLLETLSAISLMQMCFDKIVAMFTKYKEKVFQFRYPPRNRPPFYQRVRAIDSESR